MPQKRWYAKSFRRNLVDMHIDAWNPEFLSKFDPKEYFRCLKLGNIKSPMIYTQSHVGYCNWPTKSGEMHPAFQGKDKIKELIDLCHGDGMDVIAYYSLIYNNWAYEAHPDWRMRDIEGKGSRDPRGSDGKPDQMMIGQGRYGLVCPNSAGYREFVCTQFGELCFNYEFESLFLDMTFWPMICFCDDCRSRYERETGLPLPKVLDWQDSAWLQFQEARERWIGEFARFATSEIKRIRPEVDVVHQFSTATHPWSFGVTTAISDATDYTGGDLYGGFEQQSFVCKLYYGVTKNQPFEYQTSRCDPGLFDHTTTKTLEMLKVHAYLTYAHHGAFLAIDAIDPRGTLNEKFYEVLGQVFTETMPYERFLTGSMVADVGLYYSLISKMNIRNRKKRRALLDEPEASFAHMNATLGAGIALRRAHVPYGVVTDGKTELIDKYKVIVLSDVAFMTNAQEEAIIAYVRKGGCVYLSGTSSRRLAQELLGLHVEDETKETITYVRPTEQGLPYFCGMYNAQYPMTIFGTQVLATNRGSGLVLANVTLPYTNPRDLTQFASIHSNPPGIDTTFPALVQGSYGAGTVIWSSAAFESSSQPVHKQVFVNLVGSLTGPQPVVETDAPHCVELTVFEDTSPTRTYLHCVNIQDTTPMIDIPEFSVSLRTGIKVEAVRTLPSGGSVPFQQSDGYVRFKVDSLEIFRMFEISYQ